MSIPYAKVRANTARLNGKENIRGLPHHRPCAPGAVQGARRAECDGAVVKNVCKLQKAPRFTESDMVIVQDTVGMVDELRGERVSVPAMVALFTGIRLGQVLALRFVPNRLKWFAFFRGGEGRRPGPS